MRNQRNHVAELAAKASAGNPGARLQLREQMESQMVFIVRRTLQSRKVITSLDRRILAEASRLDAQRSDQLSHDPEQRIRAIAAALASSVLAKLRPTPDRHAHETVFELA